MLKASRIAHFNCFCLSSTLLITNVNRSYASVCWTCVPRKQIMSQTSLDSVISLLNQRKDDKNYYKLSDDDWIVVSGKYFFLLPFANIMITTWNFVYYGSNVNSSLILLCRKCKCRRTVLISMQRFMFRFIEICAPILWFYDRTDWWYIS